MGSTRTLSPRAQSGAVFICTLSTFLVNIDNTAYQVAAPTIVRELGSTLSVIPWILGAYTLSLASFELYAGWLGDRIGPKRLLIYGLLVYISGSLVTAIADGATCLVLARTLAGVGAAALVPMGLALVRLLSSDERQLQRYTSLWGIAVGAGMALGPLAGGLLANLGSWRMLPVASAVIAVAFLCGGVTLLPATDAHRRGAGTDYFGLNLLIITATVVTLAVLLYSSDQIVLARILGFLSVALGIRLAISVRWGGRDPFPMPGQRGRLFVPTLIVALLNYLGLGAGIAVISVGILQADSSASPGRAGLLLVPLAFGYACGSRAVTTLVDRYSNGLAIVLSGVVGLATALLAMVSIGPNNADFLTPVIGAALGLSVGAVNTPTNSLAMSQFPKEAAGIAGAFASTARQIGQGLGIALAGVVMAAQSKGEISTSFIWTPLNIAFLAVSFSGGWILYRSRCPLKEG